LISDIQISIKPNILQNGLVVSHHGNVLKIRIPSYKLILILHYSVPQPSYFESHVSTGRLGYSNDFLVVLDGVLQSWLDIRREIDSTSYMHKDLLQKARTLVPKIATERINKVISSIDSVSLDASIDNLETTASLQVAEDQVVDIELL